MAQDANDFLQYTKIQAVEISDIQSMIGDMENYKVEADALYSQDGISRVGDVSKLTTAAEDLSQSITDDSTADEVDLIFNQVLELKAQACAVIHDKSECR
jgi:hypothetical protein